MSESYLNFEKEWFISNLLLCEYKYRSLIHRESVIENIVKYYLRLQPPELSHILFTLDLSTSVALVLALKFQGTSAKPKAQK